MLIRSVGRYFDFREAYCVGSPRLSRRLFEFQEFVRVAMGIKPQRSQTARNMFENHDKGRKNNHEKRKFGWESDALKWTLASILCRSHRLLSLWSLMMDFAYTSKQLSTPQAAMTICISHIGMKKSACSLSIESSVGLSCRYRHMHW